MRPQAPMQERTAARGAAWSCAVATIPTCVSAEFEIQTKMSVDAIGDVPVAGRPLDLINGAARDACAAGCDWSQGPDKNDRRSVDTHKFVV
jgi:hypothetical protein